MNLAPNSDPEPAPPPHNKVRQFLGELLQTILLAVIIFTVINFATARIRVQSISMQPTLYESDFVLVNRLAYRLGAPARGDVIVFRYPLDPASEPYIKRLIGLPGETVSVTDGQVFVNGAPIAEPYIKAQPNYEGEWVVPDGQFFVLGDNRNNSSDSHHWGMVPLENVIGKALFIYLPITHWKNLNPSIAAAAGP